MEELPNATSAVPRRLPWRAGAVLALGLVGAAVLFRVDPTDPAHHFYPRCLLHECTGLYCPGCGMTRGLHALLHGHVLAAVRFNPLVFLLAVPLLAWAAASRTLSLLRPGRVPRRRYDATVGRAVLVVAVAFTVLRNVRQPPFTYLAPPESCQPSAPPSAHPPAATGPETAPP